MKLPDNELVLWCMLGLCIALIIAVALFWTIYFIGFCILFAFVLAYSIIRNRKNIMSFREYKKMRKKHESQDNN